MTENRRKSSIQTRLKYIVLVLLLLHSHTSAYSLQAEPSEPVPMRKFGVLLSLNEAVARALENQAEIKQVLSKLKKEEALYKKSAAEFRPVLKGEIFQAVATGEKKSITYLDAGLEQPLFQGGKLLAGKRRHQTRLESQELELEETKLDVEAGVRILYVEILRERELVRICQEQVKEISAQQEHFNRLVEEDMIPRYEFFRVETLLQSAQSELITHKETYDYLMGVLRQVIGISENESLDLEPMAIVPELDEDVLPYLKTARRYDPVYRLSGLKVSEKAFEKKELQADRFPHVSLAAKWNRYRDVFVDTNRSMIGIQGTWNIWDFGRLGHEIAAKANEIEETRWVWKIKVRDHEREIRRLFHQARAAREKIRLAEILVRERREVFKNEKAKMIAGEKGMGDSLNSFVAYERSKIQRLETITAYRILHVELARKTAFGNVAQEHFDQDDTLLQTDQAEVNE